MILSVVVESNRHGVSSTVDKYNCHELYCDDCPIRFLCFTGCKFTLGEESGIIIKSDDWQEIKKRQTKLGHIHYCCRKVVGKVWDDKEQWYVPEI
jgi:hypothetical protein